MTDFFPFITDLARKTWVDQIGYDEERIELISDQLTRAETKRFIDYINYHIESLNQTVEEYKSLNPDKLYGKDFKIDYLDVLLRVKAVVEEWSRLKIVNKPAYNEEMAKSAKKIPAKWFALHHLILIKLNMRSQDTTSGSKKEIIRFGEITYCTGQGFYRALISIDMNDLNTYIRSMSKKDRSNWKKIISEISNNNADVLSWLKKQSI